MLKFKSFSLLLKPGVEILLEEPVDEQSLPPDLEVGRDYRILCSIVDIHERFGWFEYAETEMGKEYAGLVMVQDHHKVCHFLLFVEPTAIQALISALQISSLGPLSILISVMPDPTPHFAKERRIFGIGITPSICVTNKPK